MLHGVDTSHALSGTGKQKSNKMIEQVINRRNMHLAYKQILANKGSAGVDGMQVSELKQHIQQEREAIVLRIIKGTYLPQPILGVNIPKGNGKTRLLGIPTVTERWLRRSLLLASGRAQPNISDSRNRI